MSSNTKQKSFYNFNFCATLNKVRGIKLSGAKASLSTTPREAPSSPQLSRIPRFNRRLSSTPCLEQDAPSRANSQNNLNSASPASEKTPAQESLSPSNGRLTKKRLSANDLYAESRRSSIPALSLTEKTIERAEKVVSRSSSRRPSFSDSGNGASLFSSSHFSTGFSSLESGRSSSRRGSSLTIDQDAAKREGVISYTPQIRTAPVSDPGRVQVFVRIRPRNDDEEGRGDPVGVSIEDQQMTQLKVLDGKNDRLYQFDGILPEIATNREVFKEVAEPLLRSALSGFNGILMCYGQTGTGKTYTLMSNDGMTVRVICKCFGVIKRDTKHRYTVTCSYLQIYQDKIYDLLNATRTVDLSLREHPKRGVYVENLTEYVVHSPKEVLNLLKVGRRRLVFAETQMNRASSRSHAICELRILKERAKDNPGGSRSQTPSFHEMHLHDHDLNMSWNADMMTEDDYGEEDILNESMNVSRNSIDFMQNEDDEEFMEGLTDLDDSVTSVRGKIYICDLAGSERIKRTKASGERLQEAQHINSSLLELGNVIQALAEGNRSHVPFRNSTLTRLLQEGLAGNCKTRLVVCVAPTVRDVHETKCSLNFGSRAMKVQVTAHVNYEVDYKKLAECLAAKLESLESEWNVQKSEYEKFIQTLKHEIATRRGGKLIDGPARDDKSNVDKNQVQSLLVLELMTLQLFYGLQGKGHLVGAEETAHARLTIMADGSRDVLMQSMEGLLELLNEYERGPIIKAASRTSSTGSSAITSPDYIEHNVTDGSDLPSTLEPVARFLEHAQQIEMNYKNNIVIEKVNKERTRRVLEQLAHLKETVSSSALECLKKTFEFNKELQEANISTLTSVEDLVSKLQAKNELNLRKDAAEDVSTLENSLYYLLMDKALLNCILMVGSQAEDFVEVWSQISSTRIQESDEDRKRLLEELKTEKKLKKKLESELFDAKEDKNSSEEKVKDLELELKTVRELKGSLETKLFALESKNSKLEEQVEKIRKDKSELEAKIDELEKRKEILENSLKHTENNNAKKERLLVDLRNEKVALDSIVSTLKDELTILEKEKLRDRDERKRIEEELDDVRDRNIILETEWSCCKEENSLLETELTALEEDKAEMEDELSKYREDVKMLEDALDILQKEADDYKNEISNLKSKEEKLVNVIKQEKERFNKELSAMKQEISSLRVEKRRFQRDISVSKADRSNTERAYNSLKNQKDALQGDISSMRQEEKRLHRELAALRSDKAKLEREVSSLKLENSRLKSELATAEKLKMDVKMLQKNEEKMANSFKQGREKLAEEITQLKDKYGKLESEFNQLQIEKDKIWMQLKQYEESSDSNTSDNKKGVKRVNHPHARSCATPDKKGKSMISNRPSSFGSVTEVEGKVLDLQRRLAFFMAEKEDMQKEIIVSRENNKKLNQELRTLEQDTSHIQGLLTSLSEEKSGLLKRLEENNEVRKLLESEREQLRKAVQTSKDINSKLQIRVDEICERNRVIECDRKTLEQNMKKLQGEACVLSVENKHVRKELEKVEGELAETKKKMVSLSEDYQTINQKLSASENSEKEAKEQVLQLQTENLNVKEQLADCHAEEKELLKQLGVLTEKFRHLERKVEEILIERSVLLQHSSEKRQIAKQTKELREANSILEQSFHELRLQIEKLTADVEDFREERQEVEKLIKDFEETETETKEETEKASHIESLKALRVWIVGLKEDRESLMEQTTSLANQLKELSKEKEEFSHIAADKAARLEQEKVSYQEKLRDLYKQLEAIIKEKKVLQAEVDFLRTQNSEVRAEIAIVLEENEKLENELEELEDDFEKQQNELDAAKEETKSLLRQLCGIETKNLELCTDNSNYEDDLENLREKCDRLIKENQSLSDKIEKDDNEKITMHDRMLMAELEVSRMRVECEELMEQRKRIETELISSEKDKHLLRTELTGLARALSPLKKEVRAAVEKQLELQMAPRMTSDKNDENEAIIEGELLHAQQELATFNVEKAELEEEEKLLKRKIDVAMNSKHEVRQKLHDIILELSTDSGNVSSELYLSEHSSDVETPREALPENSESEEGKEEKNGEEKENDSKEELNLGELRRLIEQSEILKEEETLLNDEIEDAENAGSRKEHELSTVCSEMQSIQEKLSLAIVSRMQLSQKVHQVGKNAKSAENSKGTLKIKDMQNGINDLKGNIKKFEKSGRTILTELKQFSLHLDHAENNLLAIGNYKTIIEKYLKQYKERNLVIEEQLNHLCKDLVEMEKRLPESKIKGTEMLLETIQLHKHQSNLEEDLTVYENHNEELKAEAKELSERFQELEQEKKLTNTTQETLEGSLENQQRKILQLQKEKEILAYEKNKLQTKLSLFKGDKRRLLDDFARLNKSLTAYAQYNGELELKLESFKEDLTSLEAKASVVQNGKAKRQANGVSAALNKVKNLNPGLLCETCRMNVQRKFSGVSKNTQVLGDELLDCIGDNMSLETAILTFIDQKSKLQEELMMIDSDRRSLENLLQAVHDKSPFDLSDSQLSLRTSTPFLYCSGRLSNRSKSMTSHSGDSFTGDIDIPPPSTPMRCHTALGICSSSSSLNEEYGSAGSVESLADSGAISATPADAALSPSASDNGATANPMDENRNSLTCFETVHEGELLDANEQHAKGKHLSGFFKKFTSSKRKKNSKMTGTGTL